MKTRPIEWMTLLALLVGAPGCAVPGAESAAAQETQAPAAQNPTSAPSRICLGGPEGIRPCPARRGSIAGRLVTIRHAAARELMDMIVRGLHRFYGPDAGLLSLDNGIEYYEWDDTNGDKALVCYRNATDAVCRLEVDAADATTELFEGTALPAGGEATVDELEASGLDANAPTLARLISYMIGAVAPMTEDGDPVFPADGPLSMQYGHWSCRLTLQPTDREDDLDPSLFSCRLSREAGPIPPPEVPDDGARQ